MSSSEPRGSVEEVNGLDSPPKAVNPNKSSGPAFTTDIWEPSYRLETLPKAANCPSPRFSHCVCGHEDYMYVFGGRNDRESFTVCDSTLHRYHFPSNTWDAIDLQPPNAPPSICGATSVVYDGHIWLFGGYHSKYTNALWKYNIAERKWSHITTHGGAPPQRRWHYSACIYDDKLWIFGGTMDRTHFNDFYSFNFATLLWERIQSDNPPRPRRRHAAVMFDDKMWVIGGREQADWSTTVCLFDFKEGRWSEIETTGKDEITELPKATDHSVYVDEEAKEAFVFGCRDSPAVRYTFSSKTWVPISARYYEKSGLGKCSSHHGCAVKWNNALYWFGGQDRNKVPTNEILRFPLEEPPRLMSSMECLLNNPLLSDLTFIVQGEKVHAHRAILYARSKYFERMFSGMFAESREKTLEIPIEDCSRRVFQAVLRYLYTDELWNPRDVKDALEALKLADAYGMDRVRDHCVQLLQTQVDVTNALELLKAANAYNLGPLRDLCLEFVVDHFSYFNDAGYFSKFLENPTTATKALYGDIMTKLAAVLANKDPKRSQLDPHPQKKRQKTSHTYQREYRV